MILALIIIFTVIANGKKTSLRTVWIVYIFCGFVWSSGEFMITLYYANYNWISSHNLLFLINPINFYKILSMNTESSIWLLFSLIYSYKTLTSTEKKLYKYKWLIFVPGLINCVLLAKNEYHRLVYYWVNENGKWLVYFGLASHINTIINLFFHLIGAAILLRHVRNTYPFNRKQWLIILFSGLIPNLICSIYFLTPLYQKYNNFDIIPSSFFLNLLLYNLAIFKYRFLNITPVAFPKMADELKESILIIDADGIIVYFNRAFKENFSDKCKILLDDDVTCLTTYLRNNSDNGNDAEKTISAIESLSYDKINGELHLCTYNKHFTVNIQPLFVKKDFIGNIITFYDISDYKKLLVEIENKNCDLQLANNQLRENASAVEKLAIVRERNRLAGDVHDSVGHTMAVLISLIGVCSIACEKDTETVKQKLNEMMDVAIKGHKELKESVQGIIPEDQMNYGIVQGLYSLIKDFEKTGVVVDFSVYGYESSQFIFHRSTIYRICQEALTNSLRHGKASYVGIILRFSEVLISLYIIDDGFGCKVIKKNTGLSSMEKRVYELGGRINFGSDGEKGFSIYAEFPL